MQPGTPEPIFRFATQQAIHSSRKVIMKKNRVIAAVLPLLFTAAAAFAQSPESSIRESTDPSRVAEVERRAQQLRSGQSTMGAGGQSQNSASGDRGTMRHEGMRGHGRRHGHRGMHGDHPKAAPNSGK
jgi:hypothetical protein